MGWFWTLIANTIAASIAAIFGDKRANQDAKDLGRATGVVETDKVVKEIADAQARNNAQFRDLNSVVDRLRRHSTGNGADPGGST